MTKNEQEFKDILDKILDRIGDDFILSKKDCEVIKNYIIEAYALGVRHPKELSL